MNSQMSLFMSEDDYEKWLIRNRKRRTSSLTGGGNTDNVRELAQNGFTRDATALAGMSGSSVTGNTTRM